MHGEPISLSAFFPVYNERDNLPATVARAEETLAASPYVGDYEIILVDDGSTDGSSALVDAFARSDRRIVSVHHAKNRGYGEALKTGIRMARLDYVFFTDADLQFDLLEVNALIAQLAGGHQAVIGYRAPRQDSFMRLVNAWGWNRLNRFLFGLRVRDIDCAFKLFERRAVQSLPLVSTGAMTSAEALIRLAESGVSIKEVPVSHAPRRAGKATGAKLSVIYRALGEMLELYRSGLGAGLAATGEAFRFMLVGVVNTLLDLLAYVALTRGTLFFSEHLLVAKLLSFLAGTVSSLLLNRSWTFGLAGRPTASEVARFYAMTSVSIAANVFAMNFFIGLGLYDLYALVITTGVTFLINFLLSKFWVFRARANEPRARKRYALS